MEQPSTSLSSGASSVNEAGPSAVTKACDMCRKKKIRCQPVGDRCVQCNKLNTYCHFTPIAKKRRRRRPAGHEYVRELEDKVKSLEAQLRQDPVARCYAQPDTSASPRDDDLWLALQAPSDLDQLPIDPVLLPTSSADQALQLAAPASRDILKIGSSSLVQGSGMPDKARALQLIEDAITHFFQFVPVFDRDDLLHQFNRYYGNPSSGDAACWACLNATFSMAYRFRSVHSLEMTNDGRETFRYLNNALDVVAELTALQHNLTAIQALICMGIILQGTPSPHIASVLVAAAMRLAQAAGLHRKSRDTSISDPDGEKRRRIYWMVYILDKDVSLRMGQPFLQDDDEMDVELPRGILNEVPISRAEKRTMNIINTRISLAIIQGQVYKRLYSVHAGRQSVSHRTASATELLTILDYWRESVPIEYDYHLNCLKDTPTDTERGIHFVFVLHLTYVYCLVMISQHLQPDGMPILDEGVETKFAAAAWYPMCVEEARQASGLLSVIYPYDYVTVWTLLHPFYASALVVLYNVIRSPESPLAYNDLEMVQPFIQLVEGLAGEDGVGFHSDEALKMHTSCSVLMQKGREAIMRAQGTIDFQVL